MNTRNAQRTEEAPQMRLWARGPVSAVALAVLVACGGGGGSDATVPTETPQGNPPTTPTVPTVSIDPLPTAAHAFSLSVDERMADASYLNTLAGGQMQAGWNMRDPKRTMVPGMKVAFFGNAQGCAEGTSNGPVSAGTDSEFASVQAKTGIAATATTALSRWTPAGTLAECDAATQSRTGPNWIFVNPVSQGGGMGVYTQVGPDSNGQTPFLVATSDAGTDGEGYNANGMANFVAFRMAWNAADAVRPWQGSDASTVDARVVSRQSLGSTEVGADDGSVVQVKQQVMMSLINTTCQRTSGAGPCQVQYLFNTAAVRAGVTDWASFSPPQKGRVWFDLAQAGLPIVAGQVPAAGQSVTDTASGLPLYRSAGAATQHASFSNQPFDLRISFDELKNAIRLIAGQKLGVDQASLTAAQIQQIWGAEWANPQEWTLVSSTFGQEVHNNQYQTRRAWIGGGFQSLYVGPVR